MSHRGTNIARNRDQDEKKKLLIPLEKNALNILRTFELYIYT
jgi:hypothetical protein